MRAARGASFAMKLTIIRLLMSYRLSQLFWPGRAPGATPVCREPYLTPIIGGVVKLRLRPRSAIEKRGNNARWQRASSACPLPPRPPPSASPRGGATAGSHNSSSTDGEGREERRRRARRTSVRFLSLHVPRREKASRFLRFLRYATMHFAFGRVCWLYLEDGCKFIDTRRAPDSCKKSAASSSRHHERPLPARPRYTPARNRRNWERHVR